MSPLPFSRLKPAEESFETRIERTVLRAEDLYDLDGETFLRCRDGRVETFCAE